MVREQFVLLDSTNPLHELCVLSALLFGIATYGLVQKISEKLSARYQCMKRWSVFATQTSLTIETTRISWQAWWDDIYDRVIAQKLQLASFINVHRTLT